jgi:ornithine cyclodeaminase
LPNNIGVLGMMPAYIKGLGVMGIKVITVFPDNYKQGLSSHQGQILLFETETGQLLGSFDASEITAIRTAAVSGLMTQLLSRPNATRLALIGTGEQAETHLEAVLSVRNIENVTVWSPRREKMVAFAENMSQKHTIKIELRDDIEKTVADADIICTLTPSKTPVLQSAWVKKGTHINAVGSSTPTARELDSALMAASKLYIDNFEAALNEAGDILIPIQEGLISEKHIVGSITDLLAQTCLGRTHDDEITVFKSLGLGIEDVAAAFFISSKQDTHKLPN